jgi:prophage regulatory protein
VTTSTRAPSDDFDRIVRVKEVLPILGVCRGTLYDFIDQGRFPRPLKLGSQLVGWRASQIREYLANLKPSERAGAAEDLAETA